AVRPLRPAHAHGAAVLAQLRRRLDLLDRGGRPRGGPRAPAPAGLLPAPVPHRHRPGRGHRERGGDAAVLHRPADRTADAVRRTAHGPGDRVLRRCGVVPPGHAAGGVRRLEARAGGADEHRRGDAAGGSGREKCAGRRGAHVRCGGGRGRAAARAPAGVARQPALIARLAAAAAAKPGATAPRVERAERAAEGLPPSAARALWAASIGLLALRALAALLPGRYLWGLDLARDVGPLAA